MNRLKTLLKYPFRFLEEFYIRVLVGTGELGLAVVLLATIDIWWSVALLSRPDTLAPFHPLANVHLFVAIATLLVGIGLVYFWLRRNNRFLKYVVIGQILIWFIVFFTLVFSNFFSTGTGVYFAIGIKSIALYLRLKVHEQ